MFEDFTYITDEIFLSNYWLKERVICQPCQGSGAIAAENSNRKIPCRFCEGKGTIERGKVKQNTL